MHRWLVLLVLLTGCSKLEVWPNKPGKRVLTTFAPLYCFTQAVAGDDANVLCLLTTTGPHDHQMSQDDALKVRQADLFIGNGLDLDDGFVDRLVRKGPRHLLVVKLGDLLPHDDLLHAEEEPDPKDKHHHHHHGEHDPHVWLSPPLASKMIGAIADALARIEPGKKAAFEQNAKAYQDKLAKMHADGRAAFKAKANRKLVTSHDSLRYFAEAFGLEIVGAIRLQSGVETDPKSLADLVKKCKDHQATVITYEPQFPKSDAESLQRTLKSHGLDVRLAEVDPLETSPPEPSADYYLQRMQANIDNLLKALP